eukprot:jgi/Botrbrau1/10614/Bobra.154_1s0005.1
MMGGRAGLNHLHRMWRVIVGPIRDISSQEELCEYLKSSGTLKTDVIGKAMLMCRRDYFLPENFAPAQEAFVDHPIRLEEYKFNVSAPHMHAACLEALSLAPGDRFLDVGSGCGIMAAIGAFIVGSTGRVVGIDVKSKAIELGQQSVRRLLDADPAYGKTACPIEFEIHNVFLPSLKHRGQYDKIHVGATCPTHMVKALVALLRPGGILVTPVAPSSLVKITWHGGEDRSVYDEEVLSQVRYGDLDVPSVSEILEGEIEIQRSQSLVVAVPDSTFAADVAAITGVPAASRETPKGLELQIDEEGAGVHVPSLEEESGKPWAQRVKAFMSGCLAPSAKLAEPMAVDMGQSVQNPHQQEVVTFGEAMLGDCDFTFVGPDWVVKAHRSVVLKRCDMLQRQANSGMKDAEASFTEVDFPQEAVQMFKEYLYTDALSATAGTLPETVRSAAGCQILRRSTLGCAV